MKSIAALFLIALTLSAEPLDEWVNRSSTARANDIAYANGLFVAVSNGGTDVSIDGTEWTRVWNGSGRAVAVHNDRFISWREGMVATSADGTNWIPRTFTPTLQVNSMTVWNDKVVLVGEAGSYWTSSDAINFQRFTVPTNSPLANISSANGLCVVSGASFAFASSNLTAWTKIRPDIQLKALAYGRALYVGAADQTIYTSTDGIQWSRSEYGSNQQVSDIIFAHGYFIASSSRGGLWTSHDGTNWIGRPTPMVDGPALYAVAASPTRVVAGSGDSAYLLQSGEIKNNAAAPTLAVATYPGITIPGVVGRSYNIESTFTPENASSWLLMETVTLAESPFLWFDASTPHAPRRFYRAILLP